MGEQRILPGCFQNMSMPATGGHKKRYRARRTAAKGSIEASILPGTNDRNWRNVLVLADEPSGDIPPISAIGGSPTD
jgi:hypothetical protein